MKEEAEVLRRHPDLRKPGPQPWNCNIAPTAPEQLARAMAGRQPEPRPIDDAARLAATIRSNPTIAEAIIEVLAEPIIAMLTEALLIQSGRSS